MVVFILYICQCCAQICFTITMQYREALAVRVIVVIRRRCMVLILVLIFLNKRANVCVQTIYSSETNIPGKET